MIRCPRCNPGQSVEFEGKYGSELRFGELLYPLNGKLRVFPGLRVEVGNRFQTILETHFEGFNIRSVIGA